MTKIFEDFFNAKLTEIAKKLPELAQYSPQSFACGHVMGYKQCLLDLDKLYEDCEDEDCEDELQRQNILCIT